MPHRVRNGEIVIDRHLVLLAALGLDLGLSPQPRLGRRAARRHPRPRPPPLGHAHARQGRHPDRREDGPAGQVQAPRDEAAAARALPGRRGGRFAPLAPGGLDLRRTTRTWTGAWSRPRSASGAARPAARSRSATGAPAARTPSPSFGARAAAASSSPTAARPATRGASARRRSRSTSGTSSPTPWSGAVSGPGRSRSSRGSRG